MWQPPQERRTNRCSAKKEFSRLIALLPTDVQMPVQVRTTTVGRSCLVLRCRLVPVPADVLCMCGMGQTELNLQLLTFTTFTTFTVLCYCVDDITCTRQGGC
jgi:hypothetical protein